MPGTGYPPGEPGPDCEENGWKVSKPINRMILKKQS
jgi:hypothetical protein